VLCELYSTNLKASYKPDSVHYHIVIGDDHLSSSGVAARIMRATFFLYDAQMHYKDLLLLRAGFTTLLCHQRARVLCLSSRTKDANSLFTFRLVRRLTDKVSIVSVALSLRLLLMGVSHCRFSVLKNTFGVRTFLSACSGAIICLP
jgi:hypothetical protein